MDGMLADDVTLSVLPIGPRIGGFGDDCREVIGDGDRLGATFLVC